VTTPIGPYSPVLAVGDFVITSGQLGVVPGPDGAATLVDGGVGAQINQALANAAGLLESQGLSLRHVVKATVFVTDMATFPQMNEAWLSAFGDHRPTRTTVGVAALPMGAVVEVEVWAYRG
jgi:2-iminobutanoate/2-iminopropanoate deaminase